MEKVVRNSVPVLALPVTKHMMLEYQFTSLSLHFFIFKMKIYEQITRPYRSIMLQVTPALEEFKFSQ